MTSKWVHAVDIVGATHFTRGLEIQPLEFGFGGFYVGGPAGSLSTSVRIPGATSGDPVRTVCWVQITGEDRPRTESVGGIPFLVPDKARSGYASPLFPKFNSELIQMSETLPLPDTPSLAGQRIYFQMAFAYEDPRHVGLSAIYGTRITTSASERVLRFDAKISEESTARSATEWLEPGEPGWRESTADVQALLSHVLGKR